jgi:hypothetical protein
VDAVEERVISKLPPLITVDNWASSPSGKCVAFTIAGTSGVHIMNFPDTALKLSGEWVNILPNGWDDGWDDDEFEVKDEYFHVVHRREYNRDML